MKLIPSIKFKSPCPTYKGTNIVMGLSYDDIFNDGILQYLQRDDKWGVEDDYIYGYTNEDGEFIELDIDPEGYVINSDMLNIYLDTNPETRDILKERTRMLEEYFTKNTFELEVGRPYVRLNSEDLIKNVEYISRVGSSVRIDHSCYGQIIVDECRTIEIGRDIEVRVYEDGEEVERWSELLPYQQFWGLEIFECIK